MLFRHIFIVTIISAAALAGCKKSDDIAAPRIEHASPMAAPQAAPPMAAPAPASGGLAPAKPSSAAPEDGSGAASSS